LLKCAGLSQGPNEKTSCPCGTCQLAAAAPVGGFGLPGKPSGLPELPTYHEDNACGSRPGESLYGTEAMPNPARSTAGLALRRIHSYVRIFPELCQARAPGPGVHHAGRRKVRRRLRRFAAGSPTARLIVRDTLRGVKCVPHAIRSAP